IAASNWYRLTRKLTAFSLTPDEWQTYKQISRASWNETLDSYEQFYRHAEIRSQKMVDNLLSHNVRNAVLMTGGFHTPQIKAMLKERGVSYILISPKMTAIDQDNGTSYLSVFTQEKSPIETLFKGEKLFVEPSDIQAGTGNGPNMAIELS